MRMLKPHLREVTNEADRKVPPTLPEQAAFLGSAPALTLTCVGGVWCVSVGRVCLVCWFVCVWGVCVCVCLAHVGGGCMFGVC